MNRSIKSAVVHFIAAALITILPLRQAYSAPGALPSAPLFLSAIVEPNVFFTLDDSTSMTWVSIVDPTLPGISFATGLYIGTPMINGRNRFYLHPDWYTDRDVVPPIELYPEAWVLKSSLTNKLYYDPTVTYVPWPGSDAAGNPLYGEFPATAAPKDPNNPSGTTTDLTATFRYDDGNVGDMIGKILS